MPLEKSFIHRLSLALLGLFVGIFQYFIFQSMQGIETIPTFRMLSMATIALFSAFLVYTWNQEDWKRLLLGALGLTLLYVIPLGWIMSVLETGDESSGSMMRMPIWLTCTGFSWFILLPFLGVYKRTGAFHFEYEKLFEYSWNNLFITLIAGFVTGIIWLLLSILAGLFSVLSISFFSDIFFTTTFFWIATPPMFTFGIALSRENERIIKALRRITLTIFRALFPVLISILTLFLAALPLLGLQKLLDTNDASYILFPLVALAHLFLNSVYQDGEGERPYPEWLLKAVHGFLLLLPVICFIAVYSLWLRIDQYGLTTPRYLGIIAHLISLVYALGYAYASGMEFAGKNEAWLSPIKKVNKVQALALSLLFLLLSTPVLDPVNWSARNQYARLMNGKTTPATFDYVHMESLGPAGLENIDKILAETRPEFADLQTELKRQREIDAAIEQELPYPSDDEPTEWSFTEENITVLTPSGKIPKGLFKKFKQDITDHGMHKPCSIEDPCTLFSANVDDDEDLEYFFSYSNSIWDFYFYDKKALGQWAEARRYKLDSNSTVMENIRLKEAIRNGEIQDQPPQLRDIEIGGVRFTPPN